jgi:hypothetical protein
VGPAAAGRGAKRYALEMRRISSWGLVLVFLCALSRDARADDAPPASGVGLGLAIGGGALAVVSGSVLLAMASCHADANGEGCPPRVDAKAAALGVVAGLVMLGVGLPMYLLASRDDRRAGNQQVASAFNAMSVRLSF